MKNTIDSFAVASRLGVTLDALAETIECGGSRVEKILVKLEERHGFEELQNWLEKVKSSAPTPAAETVIPEPEAALTIQEKPVADAVPEPAAPKKRKKVISVESEEEDETETIDLEPVESIPCNGAAPKISIMGQEKASLAFQGFINSFHATGEFPQSILMTGPAGVGKSHSFESLVAALEKTEKEINVVEIASASQLAVITSDESLALIEAIKYSARGVHSLVLIDEAQLIGKCGEAMKRILNTLIFGSGQGWKRSGTVPFQGKTIPFNTRFLSLVLITNQPEKVMKGNREAFERRFKHIQLERYSAAIMRKLTVAFFERKGITVEKSALGELVKIHRGTLESLSDFMEMASGHHDGNISRETFEKVLPLSKYSLRGFKKSEIKALKWLASTTEPRTKFNLTQNFPDLDVGAFYRHSAEQETKARGTEETIVTPFIKMNANQYEITDMGKAWLEKNKSL